MLKSYMNKLFFIFLLLPLALLVADEELFAILKNAGSNGTQKFSIGKNELECKAYGVVTLEALYQKSSADSSCRKKVEQFYKSNPNAKFFSSNMLKIMQMYHLELKKKGCVLYANGQQTLSELLLSQGLAFMKPAFEDEEFRALFYKAQTQAKLAKNGLWEEEIFHDCMVESYKEE
jgi:hypothetical protein